MATHSSLKGENIPASYMKMSKIATQDCNLYIRTFFWKIFQFLLVYSENQIYIYLYDRVNLRNMFTVQEVNGTNIFGSKNKHICSIAQMRIH